LNPIPLGLSQIRGVVLVVREGTNELAVLDEPGVTDFGRALALGNKARTIRRKEVTRDLMGVLS